ncbi:Nif3-like dinuclear metal center hexameric protein [Halomonas caseinilytica]|uniref:GTP cyclohydrolase 1 type 2 homolog n=1 Tax=Halomonas caseinilytica TaxID=438744 RepID=A0A1M6X4V5_9GAMM|nr:Nif3-like dinuclear metal center hexameric protein [Halomonas caseinilytica]SEM74411.1 dinuclear metal center protein, YbgI/SA1388 family [Halomonas caseinilytica]SHL00968.1 dinuclear metal center protein, YbgI/SA1388 family [Halomonas caseinilytica]
MTTCDELVAACDQLLAPARFKDYTVNGLQVGGRERIQRVMSGVTACQALLDEAVAWQADLVLVHHGYFWKNEPVNIVGMKRRRLATLMNHDINLLAYHLPLDAHATLGNNATLAERLGFRVEGCVDGVLGEGLIWHGAPDEPMAPRQLAEHVGECLARSPLLVESPVAGEVRRVAWCTGGAQDMIIQAAEAGADAFISGEISERTTHLAREMGIHYLAAGHHATERYGVQALGAWLVERFGVEHRFVDIDNPA